MVVLLPPRGPITPHLLLDSTNQMLTTPSRSSIFYFGGFIELFMPQIHFIVLFYHYLFCCIFWNFIYLYFLHVLYFLHLPIYTSSFCLLTPSPNPSSCPSVVLMSCSFCSLGVKILASWPLIFLPVPQSPNHTSQQERWYHPVKNSSKSPLTLFSTHSTLPALSSSSLLWTVPWFAWLTPAI